MVMSGMSSPAPKRAKWTSASALRHVDAVLAENGQDPLRIVGCDYRDRTFAQVEDEPDVFARPMPVEVKPVAKIGTAPDSPVAESKAAKLYLSDCTDLRIKHPLWTQEQAVPPDYDSHIRTTNQPIVVLHSKDSLNRIRYARKRRLDPAPTN
jgi:hypothetical protein